ncbi:hypothetical protein FHK92_21675 [Pseudomonas brassicacearum subsp. neoaurantiaca]|uniref:Uncharacterized protein n=1 Tax=Pseudomonas brassicacearum subsp. neoaurantiaca TaxID=494916 RepID=A0A7V8UFA8_9PSED|nr:hypothetical protein [Pseudomonas brassicacearum subsp. neoaurantiaca]
MSARHQLETDEPVARELAPAGSRSGPKTAESELQIHRTRRSIAASQPSGSKLPRHRCLDASK